MKPGKLTTIPSQDTVKTKAPFSADNGETGGKTSTCPTDHDAKGRENFGMTNPPKSMTITRTIKIGSSDAQRALCRAIGAPEDAEVYGMWEDVKVTWTEVLPTLPLAREQAA